ncbi:unnamed protein product [Ectocarpus sp. 6 AP-2014]
MSRKNVARTATALLLGLAVASVRVEGQYGDMDFEGMMDGYDDYFGDMMGMGDMMPGMGGMFGGMGGGMGYGGYGYGDPEPSHTDLADMAEVEKFMTADPLTPCVIGFYNEDTDGADVMNYRTAAQRMSQTGVRFGLATEDDILEGLKYKSGRVMAYPAKRFLEDGDRPKQRYPGSGALDPESLQIWVVKVVTPLVGLFTWENGGLYQEVGLPELTAYTKVDLEEDGEHFDAVAATLRKVASANLPEKKLSYVVANKEDVASLASRFQFPEPEGEEAPQAVAVGIRSENKFYRMDGKFDEKTVAEFVDAYLKGSLKPTHVEALEEGMESAGAGDEIDDEDSDVVVLTPDNFDEVVRAEGTDVMLEFYAPWCGHCKSLKPVYNEVADEVSDMPSVVVAKMDADAHTPPAEFEVQSFPTLLFLKAGDKANPIPYDGPRDKEAMVAFIRENATPPAASAGSTEL